jgi:hypothetical protein
MTDRKSKKNVRLKKSRRIFFLPLSSPFPFFPIICQSPDSNLGPKLSRQKRQQQKPKVTYLQKRKQRKVLFHPSTRNFKQIKEMEHS